MRGEHAHAARWRAAADEIHADVCSHAVEARGVFTQHYETDALDAAALLIPLMGCLPADDPRVRATVETDRGAPSGDGVATPALMAARPHAGQPSWTTT